LVEINNREDLESWLIDRPREDAIALAARAAHHWRVHKEPDGGRVATRAGQISHAERREEIARMLSGAEVTEEARAAADRLMGAA
jgi:DNA repair protein RecN (Recombination protein N)